MKFFDSSIIIDFLKGDGSAIKKYSEFKGAAIFTGSINKFEILRLAKTTELEQINEFFKVLTVLSFGENEALESVKIEKELKSVGSSINSLDVLIAGIVRLNDLTILTRDKHFKKVKSLKVETY